MPGARSGFLHLLCYLIFITSQRQKDTKRGYTRSAFGRWSNEVYKAIQLISLSCLSQLFLHRITVSCNSKHLFLSCLPVRRLRWLCSMYFIPSPRLGVPATQTLSYHVGGRHIMPEDIWSHCLHPSHSVMAGQGTGPWERGEVYASHWKVTVTWRGNRSIKT